MVDDDGQPEAYEINYVTFYAYNGQYHLPANVPLFRTGQHVGGEPSGSRGEGGAGLPPSQRGRVGQGWRQADGGCPP